jgi:type IV pilus assembly protein PilN
MSAPLLDLLRERRQELGQESMATALVYRRPLLIRGALIGAAVLGVAVGTTALLFLRHQMVKAQAAQLARFEGESAQIQAEMADSQGKLNKITATNRSLTEALTTLRTSSALLADLQLRTPDGVQLLSAQVSDRPEGPRLELKGQAVDPLAFARINAMQLELRRSPLMDPKGVQLVKLERVEVVSGPPRPQGTKLPAAVSFEMKGTFATLPPTRQLAVLRQLGSEGMARRLQLLQSEGLIP